LTVWKRGKPNHSFDFIENQKRSLEKALSQISNPKKNSEGLIHLKDLEA